MSFKHLSASVEHLRDTHHCRETRDITGGNQINMTFDDVKFVNFSSNDYLGLASDPEVISASNEAAIRYGVGSGGSSLVTGHSNLHQYLQSLVCDVTNMKRCMLFNAGFSANSGVISTLLGKHDLLLQDKLNHASLMDAGMQSPATMKRFHHNDMPRLEQLLQSSSNIENKLIVTEGIFSMDGDSGDLAAINCLAKQHDAWMMVDDAHGFGINGQGHGTCAAVSVSPDILMATFGKTIGTGGAFVAASDDVIDYLTNYCRHYIYSTALPIPTVAATIKSINLSLQTWRHDKLYERIAYFREHALKAGLMIMASESAIQPIIIGKSEDALKVSDYLKQQGIWVSAIRPPTVPKNTARLRVTLSSNHQLSDIKKLVEQLSCATELLQQGAL